MGTLEPVSPSGTRTNGAAKETDDPDDTGATSAKQGKRKTWHVRVVSVGTNSLTGARLKNGRVAQVVVIPATTLKAPDDTKRLLWGSLSTLTSRLVATFRTAWALVVFSPLRQAPPRDTDQHIITSDA